MKADIIIIGDEILIGQVCDTNSAYLAAELTKLGFTIKRTFTIGDNSEAIVDALDSSIAESDLIIITGGLGPTRDDITKDTLACYFRGNYMVHEPSLLHIRQFFTAQGMEATQRNLKQAQVPDTCEPLLNPVGTAPGMLFRKKNKIIVSLPGVPFEMQELFEKEVRPKILSHFELPSYLHKTILTCGLAESHTADLLSDWESTLETGMSLAYLPSPGMLRLRLSITGKSATGTAKKLKKKTDELAALLGNEHVFGYDNDTLPSVIGRLMHQHNVTLSVAESCTGGNIARLIISVAGASDYFKGGIVAYSNETKERILKIQPLLLAKPGAVSREVVEQMAMNVKKIMNSHFGVATSGIAGPSGGSVQKPVGTTWIAIATPDTIVTHRFLFGDNRERNIVKASLSALNMLRNSVNLYVKNCI